MEVDGRTEIAAHPPIFLDGEDVHDWSKEDGAIEESVPSSCTSAADVLIVDSQPPTAVQDSHEEIESHLQELQLDKKEKLPGHDEIIELGEKREEKKRHLNVVFIGHVDAGKSTTGGQILLLSGQVDDRTMQKYEKEAKDKNRESWYMAYIMDTNEEERIKGKTVEVGRAHFETENTRFTILDAPGHKSYVPNMISGASQADVGVLVISARKGEFETGYEKGGQTREHVQLAKTLGVSKLVVVVNKMDDSTVNWSKDRYDEIEAKMNPFLKSSGYNTKKDVHFLPLSGLVGSNMASRIDKKVCSWWDGPCLFEVLDVIEVPLRNPEGPIRMPIIDRYKDMGTVLMGKIESGTIHEGDSLLVMPNKAQVKVLSIYCDENKTRQAGPGENVRVKVSGVEEEEVLSGFVLSSIVNPINTVFEFNAQLQILELLDNAIFTAGYKAILHIHRFQSFIQHRLTELEGLPSSRGEDLQMKCLLELYGLKLVELQRKVRVDVSAELWLHEKCVFPERQLFDWGMMRIHHPFSMYGIGDTYAMEVDDRQRKKRDAERLSRLEEEEKNRVETKKRKFFAEILNAAREIQLQAQATLKRRKQKSDGIQAWHGRQRQRATRAEKLRFQALKADDQEAYMRLVEESKNERLTMLLGKTNELLVGLGAAVQRQKDAEHSDEHENLKAAELGDPSLGKLGTSGELTLDEDKDIISVESGPEFKANDLLEGQRQYNSVVHSIQEKVTEQPAMLQGGELRSYQIEGLQWMLSLFNNNLNGILADEMGLGKTIQTIALIAYLMENKSVSGPHMIVAPKAVLPNWLNEFGTWAPSISTVLYDGAANDRKALREEMFGEGKFNVLVTHYDLIMKDKIFLKKFNWCYVIVDEGHRLKNHECALARAFSSSFHIRRRLLLTGTPIQNSLQELWSLLNFLLPSIFNSVENFEQWFNAPFADKCEVNLTDEEQLLIIRRLHQVIRPFLLRRKKDEVEKFLPGKIQVILKCDMSAWQKAYYQQITDIGRVGLESGSGRSKGLQNYSMQLRKCCNHPFLFVDDYGMWQRDQIVRSSGKFELLDRLLPKLKRAGHRVLLFSQMTRLINILEIYLDSYGYKYLRLDGSTKTDERGAKLKMFNAPDSEYFMFLLSTRAGGLGLNLQTADTVIIFDSDWNPQMDQQAEDRAHRIGQKKEVRVFVLVSVGSIEEVILERAKQKMGIDAKVIQAGLFNTTSTAQDRRELLVEIMQRGTDSLGTDVPSEREINRLAARNEEEFWLFEKMDEERRQRERYKSRLMEDFEVPDWVFLKNIEVKSKDEDRNQALGKRRRREVVYADPLTDLQWMKAVENGEDLSILSNRGSRRDPLPDVYESTTSDEMFAQTISEQRNGSKPMASDDASDDMSSRMTGMYRALFQAPGKYEGEGDGEGSSSWHGKIVTWRAHKRKRSSHVMPTFSSGGVS